MRHKPAQALQVEIDFTAHPNSVTLGIITVTVLLLVLRSVYETNLNIKHYLTTAYTMIRVSECWSYKSEGRFRISVDLVVVVPIKFQGKSSVDRVSSVLSKRSCFVSPKH